MSSLGGQSCHGPEPEVREECDGMRERSCARRGCMSQLCCPYCKQGWVVPARVIETHQPIWACEECDALWLGPERPEGPASGNLEQYLESLGLPPFWPEIERS